MDRDNLRKYVEKVIISRSRPEDTNHKISFFNHLWSANIIDQERTLKGAINHYYEIVFKENEMDTKDSVYDTAIYFEVSVSTVKNVIYKFRHVSLNL